MSGRRNIAIGIDLGTSSSCVGVWKDGKVEIIPNDTGLRTTASFVALAHSTVFAGDAAKSQMASNPKNTIRGFKSLLGRNFDDPAVQEVVTQGQCPFEVVSVEDKPNVEVEWDGTRAKITPVDLSYNLLRYLKLTAEAYLDQQVTDAVITVPVCFTHSQVKATKAAAAAAGINVLRIINDCAAAAFTYSSNFEGKEEGHYEQNNILFFNVGGGNTGASIIDLDKGVVRVKATAGNTNLGGDHFDARLIDHFSNEFLRKYNKDIRGNPRALQRLRKECEGAKKMLSSCSSAHIQIDELHEGINFYTSITRCCFEKSCEDLFSHLIAPVEEVLSEANMSKTDIRDVVLVGGSTRIPKIQRLLQDFFHGKVLNKSIHLDEAPAQGAAMLAAALSGVKEPEIDTLLLLNVVEVSVGVETAGGVMTTLIPRNTAIPIKLTQIFTTEYDDQPAVILPIFEGERLSTAENAGIGVLSLTGLSPAPRGVPQIEVSFAVSTEGTPLEITAVEKSTGKQRRIEIGHGSGRIKGRAEVEQVLLNVEKIRMEKAFQVAYDCIKTSYESLLSGLGQADTYNQKLIELEVERKRNQSGLEAAIRSMERRGFPILPFQVGVKGGGPEPKRRRPFIDPDDDFMDVE